MKPINLTLVYLIILIGSGIHSLNALAIDDEKPLTPEKAFPAEVVEITQNHISVQWAIADRYYMYRSKFRFMSDTQDISLGEPELPPGKIKHDEFFGEVETYRGTQTVNIPYTAAADAPRTFTLTAISQGCADLGICYPPFKQQYTIELPAIRTSSPAIPDPVAALSDLTQSLIGGNAVDTDFLEADQAFQLIASMNHDNSVQLDFSAAEGYYLYRDKINVALAGQPEDITLGTVELPGGEIKTDEYFGDVSVYYNGVQARVPITNTSEESHPFKLMVQYQGCADAGLCYQPVTKFFNLDATPTSATAGTTVKTATSELTPVSGPDKTKTISADQPDTAGSTITEPETVTLKQALAAILTAFGVGFLLTFTPCVLPMIPILSSIIVGQSKEKPGVMRSGTLSLVYVMGTAVTYTAVGVLAGATGDQLQAYFQNPWVLGSFVAVLLILTLSMFGLYEIRMPAFIQSRIQEKTNAQQGGSYAGVFIMGLFSAAIVGACVSPGLIAVLGIAMQSQDPVLGGIIMFSMAIGMGIVLVAIGFGLGTVPKAGAWMERVKHLLGVLLLAVSIYLLSLIPAVPVLYLWAALFIITGVYLKATQPLPDSCNGWDYLWKGIGMLLLIWGIFALLGAFMGNRDILKPVQLNQVGIHTLTSTPTNTPGHNDLFITIDTVADFTAQQNAAIQQNKPLLVDFYADWCIDCLRMEKGTFSNPQVQKMLQDQFLAIQVDVTENTDADRAIKKHLGVLGPPAILFYSAQGKPMKDLNFYGYKAADEFLRHIHRAL